MAAGTEAEKGDDRLLPPPALLEDLARDYARYLKVDSLKERRQTEFDEGIDEMLTKLDEFCGLVDMIRGDTKLCLYKTMPDIEAKAFEMESVFAKVDRLEAFVHQVAKNLNELEACVNKAETEMGSFSGIKKMLSSLVSPKRNQAKSKKDLHTSGFDPPEIFHTSHYFKTPPSADRGGQGPGQQT